jgi:hypothetical protein
MYEPLCGGQYCCVMVQHTAAPVACAGGVFIRSAVLCLLASAFQCYYTPYSEVQQPH